ncbi:MAG: hypothetical protein H6Q75_1131 [Firmicutes bacterium]|nr:hypothetical protein [Bacillota bacterium]
MENSHIFAAHAQVPQGTDLFEVHKFITVVADVDMNNGEILDAMIPMYCQLTNDFIVKMIIGKSLERPEEIVAAVEERFHTSTKRALITALKDIFSRYGIEKAKLQNRENK